MLMRDDARAELLRRMLECRGHRRVGRQRAFEDEQVAPFARDEILHQPVHELGAARIDVDEFGRAQVAAQQIVGFGDVEKEHVAPAHRGGKRLIRLRRRVDEEEVGAGVNCREHGRRHVGGRFCDNTFEREIRVQHALERRRLIDPDLRSGQRMLAGLEDDALIGSQRLVTRIVFDRDEADLDVLLGLARRRRGLRQRPRCAGKRDQGGEGEDEPHAAPRPAPARGAQERNHAGATHRRRCHKERGQPVPRPSPCGLRCR